MSGIQIKGLYKIFGKNPLEAMEFVRGGMGKLELQEKHDHVLGLQDINIDMPSGRDTGHYGSFGVGQIDADPAHQPIDRPNAG